MWVIYFYYRYVFGWEYGRFFLEFRFFLFLCGKKFGKGEGLFLVDQCMFGFDDFVMI